ncbi:MAG: hypothetical protein GIW95_03185 [Candidatus Eremiobacteraeota bacterium]|nr:hypothetical protein [Candidatus Eremiobacteraeota bacterium]
MDVRRTRVFLITAAFAAAMYVGTARVSAQAPPPPPRPNPSATSLPTSIPLAVPADVPVSTPAPSPTTAPAPAPRRGRRGAPAGSPTPKGAATPEPSPTPTSPAFATLDGTWEVQVQYTDRTTYSYFNIAQKGNDLSGTWKFEGKLYPFDGSYDGRLIKMTANLPQGPVVLQGYVEGASDMVGLANFSKGDPIAFTAEHRAPPNRNILKRGRP